MRHHVTAIFLVKSSIACTLKIIFHACMKILTDKPPLLNLSYFYLETSVNYDIEQICSCCIYE